MNEIFPQENFQSEDSSIFFVLDRSYTIAPITPIANNITTIIGIESKNPAINNTNLFSFK